MPRNQKHRESSWDEDDSESRKDNLKGANGTNRRTNGSTNDTGRENSGQLRLHAATTTGSGSSVEHNLGPSASDLNEVKQRMLSAQNAISKLADSYMAYGREIAEIPETRQKLKELEDECKSKDEEIREQQSALNVLFREGKIQREAISQEREQLDRDKEKAQREKEIAAKRANVREMELENKMEKQLSSLKAKHEAEFIDRKAKLEVESRSQVDQNKKRVAALEAENKNLMKRVEQNEKRIKQQEDELAQAKGRDDDATMLKSVLKEDKRILQEQLKSMENEFALNKFPPKYYRERFSQIFDELQRMSEQYFRELNAFEDAETIHRKLRENDIGFASIPISTSQESQNLRMARAQHIISSALCSHIWQPFSSEKTPTPSEEAPTKDTEGKNQVINLLGEIAKELEGSKHVDKSGWRAARVWSALTMRALQSLSITKETSGQSTTQGSATSGRAAAVVHRALSILLPLIAPSQVPQFRKDLFKLSEMALTVWSTAQTDEQQLMVFPNLELSRRNEWRSLKFDPCPESGDQSNADIISSTQTRIFTLFPRVIALKWQTIGKTTTAMPGSFPEADKEPHMIETICHAGTGLPEWSSLVIAGKAEEESRQEVLREEQSRKDLEELERQLEIKKNEHKRRLSMAGSNSVPASPTAQWFREGSKKVPEED